MKDDFLILQITSNIRKGEGDYIYRIKQPGEAMGRVPGVRVVDCWLYSPHLKELFLCADLVINHLVFEPDFIPLVAERRRLGLATIYEISDNFLALPPSTTHMLNLGNALTSSTIFQLIQLSDAIQGVSPILMDRFDFLHEQRMVFENHVMQLPSFPQKSCEGVTIGWGGSMGHTEDLKWIAPLIKDICISHPEVSFSFMGNREQYNEVFGNRDSKHFFYRDPGSLSDYFDFLEGLDIGLAPLLDTPFNLCRSDVKFIEYASRGVVPVLSDVGPYRMHARQGENAFRFHGAQELKDTLENLIRNRRIMEKVQRNAYAYIKNERLEQDHADRRISFYKEIARKRPSKSLSFDLLEKDSADSEYYQVKQSDAEKKFIKGLFLKEKGCNQDARNHLISASSEGSNYYFPLLAASDTFQPDDREQTVQAIRLSLAMNPESLRGRLSLGRISKASNPEAARRQFEWALSVFPDFAPAIHELALMKNQEGDIDNALQLMDRSLRSNPFYAPAASDLGKIYLKKKEIDRAIEAFQVAVDLDPDNELYAIDAVKTFVMAGRLEEGEETCRVYLERHPAAETMQRVREELQRFIRKCDSSRSGLGFRAATFKQAIQ